jgi:hypothetical protein
MEQAGDKLTEYLNTNKVETSKDKNLINMLSASQINIHYIVE